MSIVAPSALFAPMPRFDAEFCPQAIGDLAKAGSLHLLDVSSGVNAGDLTALMAVEGCTEGLVGKELSNRTAR